MSSTSSTGAGGGDGGGKGDGASTAPSSTSTTTTTVTTQDGAATWVAEAASTASEEVSKAFEMDELLRAVKQPSMADVIKAAGARAEEEAASTATVAASGGAPTPATGGAGASSTLPAPAGGVGVAGSGGARSSGAVDGKEHRFWYTQPIVKPGVSVTEGPIDPVKTVDEIKKEPYALPAGYAWVVIDVKQPAQLTELFELLRDNYVEDTDCTFRFRYSPEFLLWALTPPHYHPDWHLGVRNLRNGALEASITGIPATLQVRSTTLRLCEINFLCVHKRLRSKRLAPVLIKEVTRRVNLTGIFQATYTAGVRLPSPVSSCQYWHRSLNPKKLIEIGFSQLGARMTMARTIKLYDVAKAPTMVGLRGMEARDVPAVTVLLNTYLSKFKMRPVFSEEEVAHFLLPRPGVVECQVVEDPDTHAVTDLFSFYHLPSTILHNDKHKEMMAVYSFYNVPGKHSLAQVMGDALIVAKQRGVDVFNGLNLMDNGTVLKELKFGPGDGNLQYYLYNWACPFLEPNELGLILM